MSSYTVITKYGARIVENTYDKSKRHKVFIVKEQPFSIDVGEILEPSILVRHFLKGGK